MTVESTKSPVSAKTPASAADSGADSGGDDDTKGQIDFLNSVIVDMQRKNDELKAKMELYEAAGIVDTADVADMAEYMFNDANRAQAAVAPRLFCDICDAFDLHDTEDCPTQAMPDPEEEVAHTRAGGQRGQVRVYCEAC